MKSKLAVALAGFALFLTGCGSSPAEGPSNSGTPSASVSIPAEATLTEWIKTVGVGEQLDVFGKSMTTLSADLQAIKGTDLPAVATAMNRQAPTILSVATAIASQPASDDTYYEGLRTAAAFTIRSFGKLALGLSSATDADRLQAVNDTTAALAPMNAAIKALADYISTHGSDTVHPKA